MTDRMFLVDSSGWGTSTAGDLVDVTGPEGRHAVTVVRIRAGETVLLGGAGRRAQAVVTQVHHDAFTARLVEVHDEPPRAPRFVLLQALAKGGRDEQAVEAATELGVDEVVPWQAGRAVVVWRGADKEERGRRRWEAVAAAATKASRRSSAPVVSSPVATAEAVQRVARASLALVLHEEAPARLAGVALPEQGEIVLVAGPEGGISPEELAAFAAAGATVVRLGDEVLRSSTAGPAALAVLSAMSRWR